MERKDLSNEDTLLKLASEYIEKEELENDILINKDILKICMEYDQKQYRKKKLYSIAPKVAVIALVVFLSFEIFMPEAAEAFHTRVFNLIFDDNSGSVSLNTESEYEMIGDWKEYHYPRYMPDGFTLVGAEKREDNSVLLYENEEKTVAIRIIEETLEYSTSVDTDRTEVYETEIGIYNGYLFRGKDYDGVMLTWMQNDRRITISTTQDLTDEEVIRIGENLKYIQ